MTMFIAFIFVWVLLGFFGVFLHSMDVDFVNWPMIIFMVAVPFISLIAKVCDLI